MTVRARRATAREVSTSRSSTGRALTSPVMTSRAMTVAARSVRGFRGRVRTVPEATAHFVSVPGSMVPAKTAQGSIVRATIVRNSIGLAAIARARPEKTKAVANGRSIRAATGVHPIALPTVPPETMKTTARSSPSGRPSAAAAPIANATPIWIGARRGPPQSPKRPANASPRRWRGRVSLRAAMPRNGSCRAVSPSTAA